MENSEEVVFKVLDKGFIRVVDKLGTDSSIVQAARVSYGGGTKTPEQDKKLINYLMKNKHTSPFEMCEIKFHIKAPIFVARQWLRHRTANVNEISARYTVLDDDFYIPEIEQIKGQDTKNKQGSSGELPLEICKWIRVQIEGNSIDAYHRYKSLIDKGLSRELARMVLPTNIYTQWYWKIDLHNLLHFIKLRISSHAQYEIRVYAEAILNYLETWVPVTIKAFRKYHLENFSS